MHPVPRLAVDDGVVLAGVALALVHRLAEVGAVVQHPVEVFLVDPVTARRADAALCHLARQFRPRANLEEAGEDPADVIGGFFVDDQLPALDAVAIGRHPTHPHALLPAGCTLSRMRSAVTSRSNWAKDSRMFSVSRPIDVVVLNDCVTETKVTPLRIEHFHQLGEVGERAAETVDLVDHDHVDQPILDVL